MASELAISSRAEKIKNAKHPEPEKATGRDVGYVLAYYLQFEAGQISLENLIEGEFPEEVAKDYRIESHRYDDVAVLGKRLSALGLLNNSSDCRNFRLTPRGVAMAELILNKDQISGAEAL